MIAVPAPTRIGTYKQESAAQNVGHCGDVSQPFDITQPVKCKFAGRLTYRARSSRARIRPVAAFSRESLVYDLFLDFSDAFTAGSRRLFIDLKTALGQNDAIICFCPLRTDHAIKNVV
ncbi:hypothetical protein AS156_05920 [Bradyrhizobium macuxiense]|uniref:Uncharacterized protein n=1 Tax=Bradyrhizobium macuxiense TaxID=1755647 RepID=A0A109JUB3_9BRAD|nr:hypothetical protein AS156_05920 [Bradyrhizobium macuxiense]